MFTGDRKEREVVTDCRSWGYATRMVYFTDFIFICIFLSQSTFLLLRKNSGAAANEDTVVFRDDATE